MNKNLKKTLITGASLLMMASVSAGASQMVQPAHAKRAASDYYGYDHTGTLHHGVTINGHYWRKGTKLYGGHAGDAWAEPNGKMPSKYDSWSYVGSPFGPQELVPAWAMRKGHASHHYRKPVKKHSALYRYWHTPTGKLYHGLTLGGHYYPAGTKLYNTNYASGFYSAAMGPTPYAPRYEIPAWARKKSAVKKHYRKPVRHHYYKKPVRKAHKARKPARKHYRKPVKHAKKAKKTNNNRITAAKKAFDKYSLTTTEALKVPNWSKVSWKQIHKWNYLVAHKHSKITARKHPQLRLKNDYGLPLGSNFPGLSAGMTKAQYPSYLWGYNHLKPSFKVNKSAYKQGLKDGQKLYNADLDPDEPANDSSQSQNKGYSINQPTPTNYNYTGYNPNSWNDSFNTLKQQQAEANAQLSNAQQGNANYSNFLRGIHNAMNSNQHKSL